MAKAIAIIPVGHDFPPFSASKGGSIEGSKIFLLAFDLAIPDPGAGAQARGAAAIFRPTSARTWRRAAAISRC
jgi:hypothetical protein